MSASICLRLSVSQVMHSISIRDTNSELRTLHAVVWQKKWECLPRPHIISGVKPCCAVWSVNKHGSVNRTWWGMWQDFDTTIHQPCKCLQYSWSTNSTTTLDMCWQFVILNQLHKLVLRKPEGSLFNYLSIYFFTSRDFISRTYRMRQFFCSVNRHHITFPQGRLTVYLKSSGWHTQLSLFFHH